MKIPTYEEYLEAVDKKLKKQALKDVRVADRSLKKICRGLRKGELTTFHRGWNTQVCEIIVYKLSSTGWFIDSTGYNYYTHGVDVTLKHVKC